MQLWPHIQLNGQKKVCQLEIRKIVDYGKKNGLQTT